MSAIASLAATATTGLTATAHARLVALAGPTFDYAGVTGDSKPRANYPTSAGKCFSFKEVFRRFLADAQGGICPQCGKSLYNGEAIETCHVVSRGPGVRGFIPGNNFAGHKSTCNSRTAAQLDNEGNLIAGQWTLELADMARPDLIVTSWPRWSALAVAGIADGYGVPSSDR